MISTAEISECKRYRYTLTRVWNDFPLDTGPVRMRNPKSMICFAGLNPSVADANRNDPTIVKEMVFGRRWKYDGLFKVNIFPWRDTSPRDLFAAWTRPGGPTIFGHWSLDQTIAAIIASGCESVVCCWGRHSSKKFNETIQLRGDQFYRIAVAAGLKLFCLGKNKDGSPKHPLYIRPEKELEPWP